MDKSVTSAKADLRRQVRARLAALTPQRRREAGAAVARRLAALPAVAAARTVLVFISLPTELDTWPIIRWAWAVGNRVAVPRVEGPPGAPPAGRTIVPVLLPPSAAAAPASHPSLASGAYGILEPVAACEVLPLAEIDVILAPCLAIDRAGRRLGKGGGFFDRMLADVRLRATVIVVAMAEQVVDEVPVAPHDRPVPLAVTDAEVLRFA
jgi:5-formyltetrahydrofolate cyclo-ligase